MRNWKHFGAAVALAGTMAVPPLAVATPLNPSTVQALAGQIEATVAGLNCAATSQSDIAAIQATIAASGDDPSIARAALFMAYGALPVPGSSGYCSNIAAAFATVNQTIADALEGSSVPRAGGGPGGGSPIGSPPAYVSGGGSDYVNK